MIPAQNGQYNSPEGFKRLNNYVRRLDQDHSPQDSDANYQQDEQQAVRRAAYLYVLYRLRQHSDINE